jgi:hypothetical protein
MLGIFLTSSELHELTGYSYRSRQIDWLTRNNWKFEVNAQHCPKVARSYFDVRLGGSSPTSTPRQEKPMVKPRVQPNFQAINQQRN